MTKLFPALGRGLTLLVALTGLLTAACSFPAGAPPATAPALLQWPPPPLPPRITWARAIKDARSAGIERSFWGKIVDFVSGARVDEIAQPYGIFVDEEGRLLVVDVARAALQILDVPAGSLSRLEGSAEQGLLTPIAVTGDGRGQLYFTDSEAGMVYRYRVSRNELLPFARLKRPTGIAYDRAQQRLYVTDTAAHQVVIFAPTGVELSRLGLRGTGAGEFNYPTDLFVSAAGQLYVTDPLNRRIQIFSASGVYLREVGPAQAPPGFSNPKGVAVDSSGNIYVCAPLADAVLVFDSSGNYLFHFGSRGSAPGEFWMPSGIHIDAHDTIYVADTYNRRVQVFERVTSYR